METQNNFATMVCQLFDECMSARRAQLTQAQINALYQMFRANQHNIVNQLAAMQQQMNGTMTKEECRTQLHGHIDRMLYQISSQMMMAGGQQYTFGQPMQMGMMQPPMFNQPMQMGMMQPMGYPPPMGMMRPTIPVQGMAPNYAPMQQQNTASVYSTGPKQGTPMQKTMTTTMPVVEKPVVQVPVTETKTVAAPQPVAYTQPIETDKKMIVNDENAVIARTTWKTGSSFMTGIQAELKNPITSPLATFQEIKSICPNANIISIQYRMRYKAMAPYEEFKRILTNIKQAIVRVDSAEHPWEDMVQAVMDCITKGSYGVANQFTALIKNAVNDALGIYPDLERFEIKVLDDLFKLKDIDAKEFVRRTVENAICSLAELVIEDPKTDANFDMYFSSLPHGDDDKTWKEFKESNPKEFEEEISGYAIVTTPSKFFIWTNIFLEDSTNIVGNHIKATVPIQIEFSDTPIDSDFEFLMKSFMPTDKVGVIWISMPGLLYAYQSYPTDENEFLLNAVTPLQ